ncbi:hypothetical protein EPN81_02360 [Patescibacteria group bacterium]|nr:MAG: hypothetical protein EPN81_02360 [Patescibacteria group bacterium]
MGVHSDLEQSILRTVLWFSQFSYPLTLFEIWKWLLKPERPYELAQVYVIVERSEWLNDQLEVENGFYALKGSGVKQLVEGRQDRFLDAERKFRVLRRAAHYFSLLPGVRAVAAGNTLAWWSTSQDSDIDLYVVTRPGHIWSTRFWLVLPFLLCGRRPTHGQPSSVQDPFCFSFFSTTQRLNFEELCLPRDYYMAFWVRSLVPVLDRDGSLATLQAENRWVSRSLPNAQPRTSHHRHEPYRVPSIPLQWSLTEPFFRSVQRNRLPVPLRELANLDSRVVVTDEMLKFHDNDRREQYRDTYESLLERYL